MMNDPKFGYLLPTREIVAANNTPEVTVARTNFEILTAAERAESYGFNSLWAGDSVLAKPRHDPLVTLAAVAARAESVDIGTAVYLPNLRHPATVAQQTATISLLSGGRFRFGVGVGVGADVEDEYEQFGLPYEHRGAMLNEHLNMVRTLWQDGKSSCKGDFFDLDDTSIGMTPFREPPIYIASLGGSYTNGFHPHIEERIQTHGSGWIPGHIPPEEYSTGIEYFETVADESPDALMYVDVLIGERSQCVKQAENFYNHYYPAESNHSTDEILENTIMGSVSEVKKQLERYAAAGVEEFVVRFPSTVQFEQLRSFSNVIK